MARIDRLRNIVKNKQYAKVEGHLVDLTTASLLVKVYDALQDQKNIDKFETVPLPHLVSVCYQIANA